MPRHRLLKLSLILIGLSGLMYVMISLFLPSPRRLIFGVDKSSGGVRLVQQRITFLPWHQFYRLSFEKREGFAQSDGIVRINSKEGVPVLMTYRLRFDIASERIPDAGRLVNEGWSAWIRARISEAVSAVTSQVPIEDFASPTSEFSARRDRLRQTVARHLARSGLKVTAFAIQRLEIDQEAYLRYKRIEVRRKARGPVGRVAVLGLDGVDWDLINEMVIDGRMPNLEALIKGGASGSVQTIQPTVSPLVWTTIATGLPPDRHGVFDFVDRMTRLPVDARSRDVPALWDIADAFGRNAGVVNWWTGWSPTSESIFAFDTPMHFLPGAIHPPAFGAKIDSLIIPEATIGYNQVARFLNVTAAEYQKSISVSQPNDPILLFRSMLAKTWSDHRVGLELYRTFKPMFFAISFEGTDLVNHLFAPYHPPYREGIPSESFRRYWPAVANYYSEIDRLIGEWTRVLPQDTTVIILSAYGSRWEKERPRTPPEGNTALSAHRNPGFMVVYGNKVLPSRLRRSVSVFDIAPTALALLGLPPSREMPGTVATAFFNGVQPISGISITSYGDLIESRPMPTNAVAKVQTYREKLQQIGHLADPTRVAMPVIEDDDAPQQEPLKPEAWGQYAYFNNFGVQLKTTGKRKEAVEALVKATELNPSRATPYLNLAIVLADGGFYTEAEDVFFKAISRSLPNAEKYLLDFAAYYRQKNMPSRAINLLVRGRELFPESYLIAANLGSAYAQLDRFTDALPELERALNLQPTSTLVLNNLGLVYSKKKAYDRALDYWNRSLSIQPHQPAIREGVTALQSRL